MSAVVNKRVETTAYKYGEGIHGKRPESPEFFDTEEIFRIPSTMDNGRYQFTIKGRSLITYDGFNMYACQMSHTSKGGLW